MEVYKSAENCIVTLGLLNDTLHNLNRSGVTNKDCAKFRCNKAIVIDIKNKDTNKALTSVTSDYDENFKYQVGKIVTANSYDSDEDYVCTSGIHFYITKEPTYFYSKQTLNGKHKEWYDNGQCFIQCTFVDGKYNDDYKKWFFNGQLCICCTFVNGKLEGDYKEWNYTGQLRTHYVYVNDKLDLDMLE
jgi:hypothetical protein